MEKEIEDLLAGIDEQHERVMRIQRTVERMEITGYAGNGEVTVKLRGTAELTEVYLDPQLLRTSDSETVGQLVVQAVNDGMRRLNEASRREFEPIIAESTGSF